MSRPSSWLYVWIFLVAVLGGLVLTPLARRFARRLGVVDEPGGRKAHVEPVSLLGGLAIYGGAFSASWLLVEGGRQELKGFFLAGLVIVIFGVQDDITPMDPWVKTLAQVATALVLVGFGVQVQLTSIDLVNVLLTVAWVWMAVNAFNYQDNMHGLCAGLGAVCALGLFALAVTANQYLVAVMAIGVAGGCLGFLPSNYPRARIFMGDAGSMFLGFTLAFLGIRLRFLDQPRSTTFFLPALVLAVPLFDFVMVTVSRLRRGLSATMGGTDHTSHRLTHLGMPHWSSVAVLWGVQAVMALAALLMARHGRTVDAVVLIGVAIAGLTALYLLERPRVTGELPRGQQRAA